MIKIPNTALVPISLLKPYGKNVKIHSKEQIEDLAKLMDLVGFKDPIVLDHDNTIWAGHGRLEAAKLRKMTKVPVIYLKDLSEDQKKWFMLADNKINESPWNAENVKLVLEDIPQFIIEQYHMNFDDFIELKIKDETEEIPELPKIPKTKTGEIYELGSHKIICGDSTNLEVCNNLFQGRKAVIGFTSPPYNVGKVGKKYLNDDDAMKPEIYLDFLIKSTNTSIKFCDYFFIVIQQLTNNKTVLIDYLHELKTKLVDTMIWDKDSGTPSGALNVLTGMFEFIYIFKDEMNPNRQINSGTFRGDISNVYKGYKQVGNDFAEIHSATFPIHLPQTQITNFTKEDSLIFDPFLGTGTTLIACEQTNRICYGIEIDPAYCDVIIERWENFSGQKAKKI